jgi:hypothetical protein
VAGWFNNAVAGIRAGVERCFAVINYGFRPGALPRPPPQRLPSAAVVYRDQPINLKRALVIAARQPECA